MKYGIKSTKIAARPAQERFIRALFTAHGGEVKVHKLINSHLQLNLGPQAIKNWQLRGVPPEHVFKIAELFNVSPYALNHRKVSQILGKEIPWEEAVRTPFKPEKPESISEHTNAVPPPKERQ